MKNPNWNITKLQVGMYVPRKCEHCNQRLVLSKITEENPATVYHFKCPACGKIYLFVDREKIKAAQRWAKKFHKTLL